MDLESKSVEDSIWLSSDLICNRARGPHEQGLELAVHQLQKLDLIWSLLNHRQNWKSIFSLSHGRASDFKRITCKLVNQRGGIVDVMKGKLLKAFESVLVWYDSEKHHFGEANDLHNGALNCSTLDDFESFVLKVEPDDADMILSYLQYEIPVKLAGKHSRLVANKLVRFRVEVDFRQLICCQLPKASSLCHGQEDKLPQVPERDFSFFARSQLVEWDCEYLSNVRNIEHLLLRFDGKPRLLH